MIPIVGAPGSRRSGLRSRLDGFSRYARVLEAQLDALEATDLDRFEALTSERERIQREIDEDPDSQHRPRLAIVHDESPAEAEALRLELERCRVIDRAVQERLRELRRATLQQLNDLGARTPGLRRYAGEGAVPEPAHRLDVKL